MKPMRLLFLSSDKFPPFRNDVSVLMAQEMVRRGFEIDWILQSQKSCRRPFTAPWGGGRAYVAASDNGRTKRNRLKKHFLDFFNVLMVFPILSRRPYEFILVKDKFIAALLAFTAGRWKRVKRIFWLSYPFPEASLYRYQTGTAPFPRIYFIRGRVFQFVLYRMVLPLADHIFVQSEQMKNDLRQNGIPSEKMTPIPMGIDVNDPLFFGIHSPTETRPPNKKMVYLGTLNRIRGLDFLIRVLAEIHKKSEGVDLVFIGGGDHPEDVLFLQRTARSLSLEKSVTITGFLPRKIAYQIVSEADVCVSPFRPVPVLQSTSPTKMVEYMALGKAVVASDHPEQRKLVRESRCGICTAHREKDFAEAVIAVLENPEKALEMGQNGRSYVFRCRSYRTIADRVEKVFHSIRRQAV